MANEFLGIVSIFLPNITELHAVLHYPLPFGQFAKRAQITFGAIANGNRLPF
jgi:hypothetical protein